MKTHEIKIGKYLIPDLAQPTRSRLWKKLPSYAVKKKRRILLNAPTGTGKTESAKALAQSFLEAGAKHVILAFPKISIGKAKENSEWLLIYDGRSLHKYPKIFMVTYDNLAKLSIDTLSRSVIFIDEIHELATSGFRPVLPRIFNAVFEYCPYIIGMSGTLYPDIYHGDCKILIDVQQKERPPRVLHDVIAMMPRGEEGKEERIYTGVEFIQWRLDVSTAKHFLIFVEDKKLAHRLATKFQGIVYHSGESDKTIRPDKKAVEMISTGRFPKGIRILITTSGAAAGWDLHTKDVEVIVASTHLNLSRIETLAQMVSRVRSPKPVHLYKLQSRPQTKASNRTFQREEADKKYKERVSQLKSMPAMMREEAKDYRSLFIDGTTTKSLLGRLEHRQRELDYAYNFFARTSEHVRESFARLMGITEVHREQAPRPSKDTPGGGDGEGTPFHIVNIIRAMPEDYEDDWLREYLQEREIFGDALALEEERFGGMVEVWDDYAASCKEFSKPMSTMVNTIASCLKNYDKEALLDYYVLNKEGSFADGVVMPSTLIEQLKKFKESAVVNAAIRNRMVKHFMKKEEFTSTELHKWVSAHGKDWTDPADWKRRIAGQRANVGKLLLGLASFTETRKEKSKTGTRGSTTYYSMLPGVPLKVRLRDDVLEELAFKAAAGKRHTKKEILKEWREK